MEQFYHSLDSLFNTYIYYNTETVPITKIIVQKYKNDNIFKVNNMGVDLYEPNKYNKKVSRIPNEVKKVFIQGVFKDKIVVR